MLSEQACAKINLTLEVIGRRPDGYHELHSLVAFADIGDSVCLDQNKMGELQIVGPFADSIEGPNLITRALMALERHGLEAFQIGQFTLVKRLPVAAGIGGGSADAAATLRLLRRVYGATAHAVDWQALARDIGADVSICVLQRAAHMAGVGERVMPLSSFPSLPVVLVNPGVSLQTGDVFEALAAHEIGEAASHIPTDLPIKFASIGHTLHWLAGRENDLEVPAMNLAPIIREAKLALGACQGQLLTRMSGSGPTCFGLFDSRSTAEEAGRRIAENYPTWWVVASTLR